MEGYVVFCNKDENYLKLLDVLIESVLLFSTKHVEVFSINFEYQHSSSRVLNKKINLHDENYATICYSKIYSSFNSSFEYGVQLDSDFIITPEMDKLFDDCRRIAEFPLMSRHPNDPDNQKQIMNLLNVDNKSQPYMHATYLFSESSKYFLKECYNVAMKLYNDGIIPPNYDETILNVMLWKNNVNSWVDTYDPYYELFLNRDNRGLHGIPEDLPINFYSCHGIKDYEFAKLVFENMIAGQL